MANMRDAYAVTVDNADIGIVCRTQPGSVYRVYRGTGKAAQLIGSDYDLNKAAELLAPPTTISDEPPDLVKWLSLEYPTGTVNWHAEYTRLLSAVKQARTAMGCEGNAATKHLFGTVVETGDFLLRVAGNS